MARARRVIFDNAVYHILNRGHDRGKLFRRPIDFKVFKELLIKYKQKFPLEVYHYCLVSNHFHILLKVLHGEDLPLLMKGLCQAYAFYYKKEYHLTGYLFQNRYKSIVIEKDSYLLECGRYIERNPVRAGITDSPHNYHWSSYNFYANGKPDVIITPDPTYIGLSAIEQERCGKYAEYVITTRPYEELLDRKIEELK